jgi:uncharacterized protein
LEDSVRRKDRQIENPTEIMNILKKADVCRLAMCDDDKVPYIVPMTFGFGKDGSQSLYFHSASEGKKINILKKNNVVCFEADIEHKLLFRGDACSCSMTYQSVIGTGRISFVNDPAEKIEALRAIMAHYTKKSEHVFDEKEVKQTIIMRLDIKEVSGKAHVKP